MNLKDLQEKGGFVDAPPVKKEITWRHAGEDGKTSEDVFTIHVKRLSFGSVERVFIDDKKDPDRSKMAALIAATVLLGDDGKERLSYAQAYQLNPGLAAAFMVAINEVNGTGEDAKN